MTKCGSYSAPLSRFVFDFRLGRANSAEAELNNRRSLAKLPGLQGELGSADDVQLMVYSSGQTEFVVVQ